MPTLTTPLGAIMQSTNRPARVAAFVASGALALFAFGLFAAGGVLLWADGQKDEHGYISTDSERFTTSSRALTTDNLDLDLDGLDSVVGRDAYGKVRLEVGGENSAPVFVGIARTSDVSDYLRDVDHTVVTDIDSSPFSADYRERPGAAVPASPAQEHIWDASVHGSGQQTLTWDVRDGDWSVVVMNADGSPGVHADVSAGAKLGFLDEAGWVLLGMGGLALAGAAAFVILGARPPRPRAGQPTFTPGPVAAS
jgi:hypothetical protein